MLGERKVVHVDVVADLFLEFATYVGVYFFFTYVQAAPKNDVPPPEIERTCYAVAVDGIDEPSKL